MHACVATRTRQAGSLRRGALTLEDSLDHKSNDKTVLALPVARNGNPARDRRPPRPAALSAAPSRGSRLIECRSDTCPRVVSQPHGPAECKTGPTMLRLQLRAEQGCQI